MLGNKVKYFYILLLIALAGTTAYAVCLLRAPDPISLERSRSVDGKKYLEEKIDDFIEWQKRWSFLGVYKNIFSNSFVSETYENPMVHYRFLAESLSDSKVDVDKTIAWIRLSQCLSDEDYFELLQVLYLSNLANDKKEKLVYALFFPGFEWGVRFVENHQDSAFRVWLERYEGGFENEDLKHLISELKNGNLKSLLINLRATDGDFPRISCVKS